MDNESRRQFLQQAGVLAGGAISAGVTPASGAQGEAASTRRMTRTQKLRAAIKKPGILIAPEGYTVIAAKIAEAHGFDAIYIGGSMMSGTYLGVPDWGVITTRDMVDIAGRIAREVSIPAIVDADQAGETALNVYHTVKEYERAGIAAMHIEDSLNPKHADQRSGFSGTPSATHVQSLDRMLLRLRAAVDARTDPDFVIIARTDEQDLDQIIRRGNAFAKAGADVFMVEWLRRYKGPDIDRIAREVPLPLLGINLPMRDFRDTKLKINIFTGIVSGPAAALCDTIMRELKENQEVRSLPERRLPEEMRDAVSNRAVYEKLAQQWRATS